LLGVVSELFEWSGVYSDNDWVIENAEMVMRRPWTNLRRV